jgi:pimeloyl-ACP methyl ester carboxylesterase
VPEAGEAELFVLQFPGNTGRAERMARRFQRCWTGWRAEVWSVNYPGFGGSSGSACLSAIGPAALAAHDALASTAEDRPVLLLGDSFGSVAALHVAAGRPQVSGLVLRNPPPLAALLSARAGWQTLWLPALLARMVPGDLDSIVNAGLARSPAVFLRSEADATVPPAGQDAIYQNYAGPKRLASLPGAGHKHPLTEAQVREVARLVDRLMKAEKESPC